MTPGKEATMKHARRPWWAALRLLSLSVIVAAGCGSPPQTRNNREEAKKDDTLQQVREAVRAATAPSAYQKALELANNHLAANPDALRRYQAVPKDRPGLLKALGLA